MERTGAVAARAARLEQGSASPGLWAGPWVAPWAAPWVRVVAPEHTEWKRPRRPPPWSSQRAAGGAKALQIVLCASFSCPLRVARAPRRSAIIPTFKTKRGAPKARPIIAILTYDPGAELSAPPIQAPSTAGVDDRRQFARQCPLMTPISAHGQ